MSKTPNILFLDIESTFNIAGIWGIGKVHLTFENILKEREVSVIGWAWNDEKVQAEHFNLHKFNLSKYDDDADKALLEKAIKLIEQADLVVAHNGKYFDVSVMRSRLAKHNLPDFAPVLIDDTYDQTKGIAFNSHKLDYLGRYLGEGRKIEHGLDLWIGVIKKEKEALEKQTRYCMGDVELLRRIYKRLQPYTKSTLNRAIFDGTVRTCPHCGKEGMLVHRGYRHTSAGKFKKFQCNNCRKYCTVGKNEIVKPGGYPR